MSLYLFATADAARRQRTGAELVARQRAARDAAAFLDLAVLGLDTANAVLRVGAALVTALRAEGVEALVVALPTAPAIDPWQAGFAFRRRAAEQVWWFPDEVDEDGVGLPGVGEGFELDPWAPRPPVIETERLCLTFPTSEQVADYHRRIVGTRIFDTLDWDGPEDESALPDYWVSAARAFVGGPSQLLTLALIERSTGRCLGGASLSPVDGDAGVQELGYALAEDAWGQGFATEAARALADVAFEHRGARRVVARVLAGNTASEAVLRKAGFELEGLARAQHRKRDADVDGLVYGLARAQWHPSGSVRRVRLDPR